MMSETKSSGKRHKKPLAMKSVSTLTFEEVDTDAVKKLYDEIKVTAYKLSFAARHNTPNLSSSQKIVLSALCDYANRSGICFPFLKGTLESDTGLEKHAIFRAIKQLCELGYIADFRRKGRGYCFLINAPLLLGFDLPSQCTNSSLAKGGQCTKCSLSYNLPISNLPASPHSNEALKASSPAVQAPTAEPTEPLANCAQQSLRSLADEPMALAQSATPTKPPFKYCRPTSNTYYCEDPQPGVAAAC